MTEQDINISQESVMQVAETNPQSKFQRIVESVLRAFGIQDFVTYAQVLHNFLFVVAIVFIGILEIFNTHLAVRLNRGITKKTEAIKELRWEFMTVKTEMNQRSKQSELQKVLEPYGLKTLQEAPKKIEVKKGTLE
jgi:cell division protein FtsL